MLPPLLTQSQIIERSTGFDEITTWSQRTGIPVSNQQCEKEGLAQTAYECYPTSIRQEGYDKIH